MESSVPVSLDAWQWIQVFVLGAFAGAVGQLVRSIAGVARQNRLAAVATASGQSPPPDFQVSTLVTSLIIGAVAGIIAAAALHQSLFPAKPGIPFQTILGIMAAGYTGADFIEGIAGKYFPQAAATTLTPEQLKAMQDEVAKLVAVAAASGAQVGAQAGAAAGAQAGARTGAAAANAVQTSFAESVQEPAVG